MRASELENFHNHIHLPMQFLTIASNNHKCYKVEIEEVTLKVGAKGGFPHHSRHFDGGG